MAVHRRLATRARAAGSGLAHVEKRRARASSSRAGQLTMSSPSMGSLRLLVRRGIDGAYDFGSMLRRIGPRLDRLAETLPRRHVLALGVYRKPEDLRAACAELRA